MVETTVSGFKKDLEGIKSLTHYDNLTVSFQRREGSDPDFLTPTVTDSPLQLTRLSVIRLTLPSPIASLLRRTSFLPLSPPPSRHSPLPTPRRRRSSTNRRLDWRPCTTIACAKARSTTTTTTLAKSSLDNRRL